MLIFCIAHDFASLMQQILVIWACNQYTLIFVILRGYLIIKEGVVRPGASLFFSDPNEILCLTVSPCQNNKGVKHFSTSLWYEAWWDISHHLPTIRYNVLSLSLSYYNIYIYILLYYIYYWCILYWSCMMV